MNTIYSFISRKWLALIGVVCFVLFFASLVRRDYSNLEIKPVQRKDYDRSKPFVIPVVDLKSSSQEEYTTKCMQLYKYLRFPAKELIHRPPLKIVEGELRNQFEQNGDMPITRWYYFNDAYNDAASEQSNSMETVSKKEIDRLLTIIRAGTGLGYNDTALRNKMYKHQEDIRGKSVAVIGTVMPWIEAVAFELGASVVTTLDYTRKKYEQDDVLKWVHVNDYLDDAMKTNLVEHMDNIASFSSLEHAGLGRFGDPLSPFGDADAIRQTHCMLKPNGLFFLALPTSSDGSSFIEFNAHRVYGTKRLKLLFAEDWEIVSKEPCADGTLFLLKKLANY